MSKITDRIAFVPAHESNYGGYRDPSSIKYIVVHYTGNDGDHDTANANYYAGANRGASAHYFVDDDSITQSVRDHFTAWAVGGKKWSDCAQTGGGTLYGVATNANSISVELCDTQRDGTLMATEATLANAVELIKLLMAKYSIPIERVVRHFDVNGKHCPAYFMDNGRWEAFKARLVRRKDENMRRYQTVEEIRADAPWAAETVDGLIARGALNGTGAGFDLSEDMLRLLVIVERAYGR